MSNNRKLDELCYPFIHDAGSLCDFEVASDELCSHVGVVLGFLTERHADIVFDLEALQPLCWHANGSVRGRLAISGIDMDWLHGRYNHYKSELQGDTSGFVLPRGPAPVPQLHLARSAAKKVIRVMVRLEEEGIEVDPILKRFCNLSCNFFFVLTRVLNQRAGNGEVVFESKSYGKAKG